MKAPEAQISYEMDLIAPTGGVLRSITVEIRIEPPDAGLMIYGTSKTGEFSCVQVVGGTTIIDLPFADPHIWVKKLGNLKKLQVHTLGWQA